MTKVPDLRAKANHRPRNGLALARENPCFNHLDVAADFIG
jgi:hypothetical protein